MSASIRLLPLAGLIALACGLGLAPPAGAQTQPADIYWADAWNTRHHHFSDQDGDGLFFGPGEVSLHIDPTSPANTPARSLRITEENGQVVSYWLGEFVDVVYRGVDGDADGTLAGAEITVFRDSGVLDGAGTPVALDIADDGAVWWTSTLLQVQPHNGLFRLEDLNSDGDAADHGEQVQMIDGNTSHPIEHDSGTTVIDPWSLNEIAAAGDGMIVYDSPNGAHYRIEDLNQDGDATDAGESILLLNSSGENPALPMNPDFADGTLRSLQTPAGFPAALGHLATTVESGSRVFYFGTTTSPFSNSGTNNAGEGTNFLIFRGIDGNADGDVNDAGEVELFFNGSHTDGSPPLLLMRGMDVLDGGQVYAAEILPFPALFPGPNGNLWIHTLDDLNGDGDAHDPFELRQRLFDLQVHGVDPVLFPIAPQFGNLMGDPWDFAAHRVSPWTDMQGGAAGVGGVPALVGSGPLSTTSGTVDLDLTNAPANAPALFWVSLNSTPTNALGGTVFTLPLNLELLLMASPLGEINISGPLPAGIPQGLDLFIQFVVRDLSVPGGLTLSNAVKGTTN